jgi:predicted dehydrogenase
MRSLLVGCGVRGSGHVTAYGLTKRTRLVGCCDARAEPATAAASRAGVPAFTDVVRALEELRDSAAAPEVVDICTPPEHRLSLVRDVLRFRPAVVLLEKPVSLFPQEALALREACDSFGTRLIVNHQLRYFPPLERLRSAAATIDIGAVLSCHVTSRWPLAEHGTHLFDLVAYVFGAAALPRRILASSYGFERRAHVAPGPRTTMLSGDNELGWAVHGLFAPWAPWLPGRVNPWHQTGFVVTGTAGSIRWSLNNGWSIERHGNVVLREDYRHEDVDDRSEARLLDDLGTAPNRCELPPDLGALGVVFAAEMSSAEGRPVDRAEVASMRDDEVRSLWRALEAEVGDDPVTAEAHPSCLPDVADSKSSS